MNTGHVGQTDTVQQETQKDRESEWISTEKTGYRSHPLTRSFAFCGFSYLQ